jgi:hypothetical protein
MKTLKETVRNRSARVNCNLNEKILKISAKYVGDPINSNLFMQIQDDIMTELNIELPLETIAEHLGLERYLNETKRAY